jgi:quinoprotein glucose dehydrogenase
MHNEWIGRRVAAALAVALSCSTAMRPPSSAQEPRAEGHSPPHRDAPATWEWRSYGGDLANTRYAPLGQIDAENFSSLEIAWRFKTENLGPRPEFNFQATPLMVGGVVFTTAGSRRSVVALDAATGELLWMHRENEGKRGERAPRRLSGRGLAYWSDGASARIIYVTPGYRLVALDAKTGVPIPSFGDGGAVDLKLDMDQALDPDTADVGLHAAPVVAGNAIVVGAAHSEGNRPRSRRNTKGYVRAFDVQTGRRLWIFHTIPRPGDFGAETWENGSAEYTGNTGVWAQISIDEALGLVYLPTEMPTGDYYGGHRPGANLFSDSLVAVELRTGKRRWHFQFIRHDLWDWDLPCAPILADVTIVGRPRRIVAQATKQGWVYVFDRESGQPIWPIEDRPVAPSDVPGERSSPTQPFVTKPPPFERQGITIDDLIDFTPELRDEAVKLVSRFKLGPLFTPPVVSTWEGPLATLVVPSTLGGANWPGGSLDPETGMFYIFSNSLVSAVGLVPGAQRTGEPSDMSYISGQAPSPDKGASPLLPAVRGLPLLKPPYARITAIDLRTGELRWQIPHGETPEAVSNHRLLKTLAIPRTGHPGFIGPLATRTLLVAGDAGWSGTRDGRRGAMLRAYDKATGREVGAAYMPAPQSGSPMTYAWNGQQYIVVAVSGPTFPGELVAFRLPPS